MDAHTYKDRFHCNECGQATTHTAHFSQEFANEHDFESMNVLTWEKFVLCSCAGCGSRTVLVEHTNNFSPDEGVTYYPPRYVRKQPAWLYELYRAHIFGNDPKCDFFREIYEALQIECYRLVVLGIRSLVEHVMIENLDRDRGRFRDNLQAFQESGQISDRQREVLEHVIDLGNSVTHRAFKPSQEDAIQALDVVETIIKSIYIDSGALAATIEKLPPRKPRDRAQ